MTWMDFEKAYNFREAEKCCANCKHGEVEYEGECTCNHPLIDKHEYSGNMIHNVCDLWEKKAVRMGKYIDELMAMAEDAEKVGDRKMAEGCRRTAKCLLDYLCYIEQTQGCMP